MTGTLPTTWFADSPLDPWTGAMRDLEQEGLAVIAARVSAWAEHLPTGTALLRLLGGDYERHGQLPPPLRPKFAATRLLMKYVASVALCCAPEDIDLGYSFKGRAFVRGQDRAHLSLSHTQDVAVVAISHIGTVGVDIEHSGRDLQKRDITGLMCTPAERLRLAALPPADRQRALLRTWTLKEAYSKALGQGLQFAFTGFGFDVTTADGRAVLRRADDSVAASPMWDLWTWEMAVEPTDGAFTLALAAPRSDLRRPEHRAMTHRGGHVYALLRGL